MFSFLFVDTAERQHPAVMMIVLFTENLLVARLELRERLDNFRVFEQFFLIGAELIHCDISSNGIRFHRQPELTVVGRRVLILVCHTL